MNADKKKAADATHTTRAILIDLQNICKQEIKQVLKLVRDNSFSKDLRKQKELALLFRGMALKVKASYIADSLDDDDKFEDFLRKLFEFSDDHEPLFRPQLVNVKLSGDETGPAIRVIYENKRGTKRPATSTPSQTD